ncbi:hydroxymethylglutaryl-CoA lyase [Roseivirga sp.]|uniref:hydroxymethylglutaryl-CoA lyase n=1 Tax=Roseivirga sp. TaxID=1964215 RepID=UPI003B8E7195
MKIIECPRDAMQGLHEFIPTDKKAAYINQLLEVGFDTIDFGSFVSPKAIPQLSDTAAVLDKLDLSKSNSKLLAIIANLRGATDAVQHGQIDYLGFPLSISEQFQKRNTNKTVEQALEALAEIQNLCLKSGKTLITYISMGFGNPYGEEFNEEIVAEFVEKLNAMDAKVVSLSDTIGIAEPALIERVFAHSIATYPQIEFGAHFHSTPEKTYEKLSAALKAGCKRFDAAIKGFGGCPMADDDLTGNIATEKLLSFLAEQKVVTNLDMDAFQKSMIMSADVFPMN